jgi:hypothetical protein
MKYNISQLKIEINKVTIYLKFKINRLKFKYRNDSQIDKFYFSPILCIL